MAKLTITVPTGKKCNRCPYLASEYTETSYGNGYTKFVCKIFKVKIVGYNKCNECYLQTVDAESEGKND